MKSFAGTILRAISLGTSVATVALALMSRINIGQAILLLAIGQSCLAAASLNRFNHKK